jgi:twinkle protein
MLHDRHRTWLESRGILSATAEGMEVSTVSDSEGNWLAFPYRLDGALVNRKYRLTSEKRHRMDKNGKLCLWNAECLRSERVRNGGSVIITEGEFDAMVAMQCGFPDTTSVPNGAPAERIDDPVNSNRYRFLYEHETDLAAVKSFILAADADGPGRALAHDLAAILGPERCRFITYPEGTKDLNEVMLRDGQRAVVELVNNAKPYPVQGLYRFSDFPDAPPVQGMDTGIECLDDKMQVVLGTLTVFTGYSNMGKSTVVNTIAAHCVSRGVPICIASFETMPKPILIDGIARAMLGCSSFEYDRHPGRQEAHQVIEDRVTIISNTLDDDLEFNIETLLDTARTAVIRDGVRVIFLDPWNELEQTKRRDETTTEYVGRAIRKVKAFARRHNVSFWIVAHPTKPIKGTNTMPSLYDISDSANWANKADYGLVYHRPDKMQNEAQLAVVKVRMGLPGRVDIATVKFDHRVGRITDIAA